MLLNKELEDMMNKQYTNEVSSALLYKNIAGYYDDKYFPGFGKFFQKKYEEELEHAQRFYEYINKRDGRAKLVGIPDADLKFNDGTDLVMPFYDSLKHEQQVSTWIYQITDKALELKDHGAYNFMLWYCTEQESEEAEMIDIIAELELVKNDGGDLYKISRRLGEEFGKSDS